jgi:DNA topoisomerase-1
MGNGEIPGDVAAANLNYVSDDAPGIRRYRRGTGFSYVDRGRVVRDAATLKRIRALAIPPAWTDVWISTDPMGHLQGSGRDAASRKQYRYHAAFRSLRDSAKYEHLTEFAEALPAIRRQVAVDMWATGLPRRKVVATIVYLLDVTLVRVGNEDYAQHNGSYGLTTLRNHHVAVNGSELKLVFKGKSGKQWRLRLRDRRVARVMRSCQELPGQHLFQYIDEKGEHHAVGSADVNDYLRDVSGKDVTAKDFRTFAGTVVTATTLAGYPPAEALTLRRANLREALETAARRLGNTPAVTRQCYVHPAIIGAYLDNGVVLRRRRPPAGLTAEEAAVMDLLKAAAKPRPKRMARPAAVMAASAC